MTSTELPNLIPTGKCWCGCGKPTSRGAFFANLGTVLSRVLVRGDAGKRAHPPPQMPGRAHPGTAIGGRLLLAATGSAVKDPNLLNNITAAFLTIT